MAGDPADTVTNPATGRVIVSVPQFGAREAIWLRKLIDRSVRAATVSSDITLIRVWSWRVLPRCSPKKG
jgi:hypothetical protein